MPTRAPDRVPTLANSCQKSGANSCQLDARLGPGQIGDPCKRRTRANRGPFRNLALEQFFGNFFYPYKIIKESVCIMKLEDCIVN